MLGRLVPSFGLSACHMLADVLELYPQLAVRILRETQQIGNPPKEGRPCLGVFLLYVSVLVP